MGRRARAGRGCGPPPGALLLSKLRPLSPPPKKVRHSPSSRAAPAPSLAYTRASASRSSPPPALPARSRPPANACAPRPTCRPPAPRLSASQRRDLAVGAAQARSARATAPAGAPFIAASAPDARAPPGWSSATCRLSRRSRCARLGGHGLGEGQVGPSGTSGTLAWAGRRRGPRRALSGGGGRAFWAAAHHSELVGSHWEGPGSSYRAHKQTRPPPGHPALAASSLKQRLACPLGFLCAPNCVLNAAASAPIVPS